MDLFGTILAAMFPQFGQQGMQQQPQQQPQNPLSMLGGTKTSTSTTQLSSDPMVAMAQKKKLEEEAKKKSGTRIAGIKI